jgi:aminoglycoside phosphotransferase family enzyme/predicted kinase
VTVETTAQHEALIQSLMDPVRWPGGGSNRQRIDTHISTVILAGDVAYKLKKPLDLGFLDFYSIEARHRACNEELRLNRRLAPHIYQAVCAVTGSIDRPQIDGDGEIVDWAVRMQRFDPDAILSKLMHRLDAKLIDLLAERVARFHADTAKCDPAEPYGSPDAAYAPMQQNLAQIVERTPQFSSDIRPLAEWTAGQRRNLEAALEHRKALGHIRECHGDLHLGNVALIDEQPVMFDAIEFNPGLRWIDTINDIAFMTMDLQERGRTDLAYRFLDRYLQESGDYGGLRVLRFYEVYRALVRAKIAAIRSGQADLTKQEREDVHAELTGYIAFAKNLIRPRHGAVVITHGVSGSGKSHVAKTLTDFLPAVRLRSDIERKRILGVDPRSDATGQGAYSSELTTRTYAALEALAESVVRSGYVAVVDATFLKRAQRDRFRLLARTQDVPFLIVDCDASLNELRDRILARRNRLDNVSDADLSVLDAQLESRESLSDAELAMSLAVRPGKPLNREELIARALSQSD